MEVVLDILIPTLGRPHDIPKVIESLEANTNISHRAIFIPTAGDDADIEALTACGAEFMVHEEPAGRANFARKINWAYERTDAEWVFQGATDLRFHPGWDKVALRVAERSGKRVIGTNDSHNPQVKRGMQSTHTLIARSYIEEYGGLDNTGKVFSEAYDHQYVDLEFCELARKRNEWAFAKQAIVEHLHPHWGLAEEGETYKKAMRSTASDYRLYMSRMGHRSPRARDRVRKRKART